jgi:hypothetical protein
MFLKASLDDGWGLYDSPHMSLTPALGLQKNVAEKADEY